MKMDAEDPPLLSKSCSCYTFSQSAAGCRFINLQVRVPGTHGMIFNMFECILKFKNTKNIPNDERWTT